MRGRAGAAGPHRHGRRALARTRRRPGRRSTGRCPRRTRAGGRRRRCCPSRVDAESIGALRSVHTAAQLLGAVRLVEEIETLARWYRVDLLPEVKETVDADADSEALEAYALTAREREVLAALAAGHTNKEIADTLFISVKTASVHVSNILRKLDVPGRQEAARVAHRLGVSPADVN